MASTDPPVPSPSPPSLPSLLAPQQTTTPPNEIVNPELHVPVPIAAVPVAAAAAVADPSVPSAATTTTTATATATTEDPYAECSDADASGDLGAPRRGLWGFCRETEDERFERVLARTSLTRMQKNSIRRRFFEILREFRARCRFYSLLFHVGHFTITVGSLVVPALLSVQYASAGITFIDPTSFQSQVYWTTWILSLLVTMFNGILVLFKVDMKYYFLHTTLERLRSEGWQYLQLTGRYSGSLTTPADSPTHKNQYKFFCHYVEKIKLKQVEEEYYKYEDAQKNTGGGNGAAAAQTGATATATAAGTSASQQAAAANPNLYPPSLNKNLATLAEQAPPSVQEAIRGLVRTQTRLPNETIGALNRVANATNSTSPPLPMQSPLRQATN
jgi:hypothetical protein